MASNDVNRELGWQRGDKKAQKGKKKAERKEAEINRRKGQAQ